MRKFVHDLQAGAVPKKTKIRWCCQHDVDSRDFFCDLCHHPPVKIEDQTLEGERREAAESVLRPNDEPAQRVWVSKGTLTSTAKESKQAKDPFKKARADGYDSVPHRYISDAWYRDIMNELGVNSTDMRK